MEGVTKDNTETIHLLSVGIQSLLLAMENLKSEIAIQENTINLHDITLMQMGITIGEKNHAIKKFRETVEKQNLTICMQNEVMDKHIGIIDSRDKCIKEQCDRIEEQSREIEILRENVSVVLCRDDYWSLLQSVKKTVNELRETNRYTVLKAFRQKFTPKAPTVITITDAMFKK